MEGVTHGQRVNDLDLPAVPYQLKHAGYCAIDISRS